LSNEGKKKAEEHRTSSSLHHRRVLAASPPRVPPPFVERRTQRWLPALAAVAFWVPVGAAAAVKVNVTLPFWLVVRFFWPRPACSGGCWNRYRGLWGR
jgi:hypothetical protein